MTLVAAEGAEMDWVDKPVAGMDPDADVGFWSMSPASAEQVTVQIRTVLDRAWEFIALAYKGRAFIALRYANWDAYVDARFGDLRIVVPREHRAQVVAELVAVRMSCRAIAKVLGVGVATVHRELTRNSLRDPPASSESDGSALVIGRDGKEYPRNRRTDPPATGPCSTCGEHHPAQTGGCPWDLFAQGRGPHPLGEVGPPPSSAEEATYGLPHPYKLPVDTGNREAVDTAQVEAASDAERAENAARSSRLGDLTQVVGQLEAVLEKVSGLGDLVHALEDVDAQLPPGCRDVALHSRVRGLGDDLAVAADQCAALAVRLGRVADTLGSSR
jgi:hypothetical protein